MAEKDKIVDILIAVTISFILGSVMRCYFVEKKEQPVNPKQIIATPIETPIPETASPKQTVLPTIVPRDGSRI